MKWNNKFSLAMVATLAFGLLPALAYEDTYVDGHKLSKKELKAYRRDLQHANRYQGGRVEVSVRPTYARATVSRDYWVPENVYHGWDRHSRHFYNHHYYGWHNGAWIIIEPGESSTYYAGGSIVSRVQERLAERGYYRGPVDGDAGPGTRSAIASYQADHGLRVTGHINDALLGSLRLD